MYCSFVLGADVTDPRVCVVDLETDSLDVNEARIRVFSLLDLQTDRHVVFKWIPGSEDKASRLLNQYDVVVTFNGIEYDLPILQYHGVEVLGFLHVDVLNVFRKRGTLLRYGGFPSYKLKNLVATLYPEHEGKGELDYRVFLKPEWTEEEKAAILEYCVRDLKATALLWRHLLKEFETLAQFLPEDKVARFDHVRTSPGSYVYKAICHLAGLEERYDDETKAEWFPGAFVSDPLKEVARGKTYCFDFTSLYPTTIVQANLQSWDCECCSDEEKWRGGGFFEVRGAYCAKKQGRVEQVLKRLFEQRKAFKLAKDPRQYAIKILLNTFYGASGNPVFQSIYHLESAADTAGIGRQCAMHARARFEEAGYDVLYTDTDSVYVQSRASDLSDAVVKAHALQIAKAISAELRGKFPFPWEESGLALESEIAYIYFFKDEKGNLIKKHYLYVTTDGKLVVKGLAVLQKSCSPLAVRVFEVLKPLILERLDATFDRDVINDTIKALLAEDPSLVAKRFTVRDPNAYANASSLQAQIATRYGAGEHFLVKNAKIGVGKAVKYCTFDELGGESPDLEVVWKELAPFVKGESP